ncbi:hypothetical protein FRC04_001718 [Tulasnella sp. 424]|nr:hypothetical protein FRC04_001718 [Tulasnella sp. 424]KAG8968456.1 hypothetical protein FRC05_001523 [Tulasnella sp. 425]
MAPIISNTDPANIAYVDIYPPIAVARVGDSDEWFIGPEVPGIDPLPMGGCFKDIHHRIKRCAPRFRIYAFDSQDKVLAELNLENDNRYKIEWTVHVANKKSAWVSFRGQYEKEKFKLRNPDIPDQQWASPRSLQPKDDNGQEIHDYAYCDKRHKLIIDSGLTSISGKSAEPVPLQGKFWGSKSEPILVKLGAIATDDLGRLIVHGSDGHAKSWDHVNQAPEEQPFLLGEFDNDGWFDTMSDGHVTAKVTFNNNGIQQEIRVKNRATVITAPPHYAHGNHCPTTLYELIEDIYERQKRSKEGYNLDELEVNYYKHIDPLFRRMYMNSWTNFRANEGHGPRRASLFLDNPDLANPETNYRETRERIFNRVRAPVVKKHPEQLPTAQHPVPDPDPKNFELRKSQAYMYWMPRLGGNGSDLPEAIGDKNGADRWASLTQLQYDRLKKWSEGDFVTGEKVQVYKSFDEIPLAEQPHALTFAALEWSVGAPLYPGIECFWVAEFGEMYDLDQPFSYRFGEKAQPGNLTRGLALPWQADFYMCNSHWWPSVRPDDVVTEEYFTQVQQNFQHELHNIPLNLTDRRRWDDGLDRRPKTDPDEEDDDRYGNSEMVRKWFKLGFVSSVDYGPQSKKLPISIEQERYPGFSRIPIRSNDPVDPPPIDSDSDDDD